MALEFQFSIANPHPSTHEGLRVACRLGNPDSQAAELPAPYDRSGAFRIGLCDTGQTPLRTMSRLSRQAFLSEGRVDTSLDLDTLEPGQEWNWKMDLASFHYPIPAGEYLVNATYEYPPAGVSLDSGFRELRVASDPVTAVEAWRDNPCLDGLALLIEADTEAGPAWFLRQHNHNRPVGAWFSSRVATSEQPDTRPYCATCNFLQTESLDPFFEKWVLWTAAGELRARRYDSGAPTDRYRAAVIPEGRSVLRAAIRTLKDSLYVFFLTEGGLLECYRFEEGLTKVFEHGLRAPFAPLSIAADREFIHIAMPWRGVFYERLRPDGRPLERMHVFRSRLCPVSVQYDPAGRRIKALFRDGPHGKTVQMAGVDFGRDTVSECRIDSLGIRDDLNELSFDQDSKGRFHLLASTAGGKLYYLFEGAAPRLIAEGEERFFPMVVAPLRVYLGCYRRECGYRFLQFRKKRRGPKLLGLDPHG